MSSFETFEDIEGWQKARSLTNRIYGITDKGEFSNDFGLKNQIQSATVSVMANIAEGFGRGSNPEFIRFLYISKSSCAEVQSHLYVAMDKEYISQDTFNELYKLAEETQSKIMGLINYLEDSNHK